MLAGISLTNNETAALDGRRGLLDFLDRQSKGEHHVSLSEEQINPH